MPRKEVVLSVFIASPQDVEEERNRIEDVIREFNQTWTREFGLRLEPVKWETHTHPDFGADAQAVINKQISQDYDFFIGIMWCSSGTPTARAASGTIEEFQLAKQRYDRDPKSVKIMVYFKDAPVPPSDIDPKQIHTIADFRSSLGKEGAFYWKFDSSDDFEELVRRHLNQQVIAWKKEHMETVEDLESSDEGLQASPSIQFSMRALMPMRRMSN